MTQKQIRRGLMIVLAVLLVTLAFAGVASAADSTTINNVDDLYGALGGNDYATKDGNTVTLKDDVFLGKKLYWGTDAGELIIAASGLILDLNGHTITTKSDKRFATINEGMTFTVTDSKKTGKIDKYGLRGGGVYVNGGTFILNDGSISGSRVDNGAGVYVNSGTFTMNGGSITDCVATKSGGGVYVNSGTFTLNGGSIDDCHATLGNGGGVYVNSGTFTQKGGKVVDCGASVNGGGVYINSGTFTLKSGSIDDCHATVSNGGGVYVAAGTFTQEGGSIIDCGATANGGGVYVDENGRFTMTSGSISSCRALSGDFVYVNGGDFDMAGGSLAYSFGNGVCINDGAFDMTGGSLANCIGTGVYLKDGTFTLDGAAITNCTANGVSMDAGEFTMTDGTISKCGTHGVHIYDGSFAMTGGTISECIDEGVYMDAGTFTMENSAVISACSGGGVYMTGGTFTMSGATISSCGELSDVAGGVYVSGGTFEMKNGATISKCSSLTNGGGVYVKSESTFTMTDGVISDCTATGNGGGVYVDSGLLVSGGVFTLKNGTISGCSADLGAGVYIDGNTKGGVFTMDDGTITGCNGNQGGGVYANSGSTFTLNGGSISDCHAKGVAGSYGGGVYVGISTFTLTGGTISDCSADNGAGVYLWNGGTFTMTEGTISSCQAAQNGGGVNVAPLSTFAMAGGTITGCTATEEGNGVFVNGEGIFKVSGTATITGNKKGSDLGNVHLKSKDDLCLAGQLSGMIGITYAGAYPHAGEKFGYVLESGAGAENITSDKAGYAGTVSGDFLIWQPIEYAITYALDGGNATNPSNYTVDTPTITLTDANKTGYVFEGWYNDTSKSAAFRNNTIPFGSTGARSFWANYTANVTTVVFHAEDTVENRQNTYAQDVNFSSNPIRTGYIFTHWNVSSTGLDLNSSVYVNDGKWNYTGVNGGTLDVYANWTEDPEYPITETTAYAEDYVYGGTVSAPYLDIPMAGAEFYYTDSAVEHDYRKSWNSLTPTTLDAGIYYVYAELDGNESRRTTFKVQQASQNAPGITSAAGGNGFITVTVGGGSAVKNYEYVLGEGSAPVQENWISAEDADGTFVIGGLKASTQYSVAVRAKESRNYLASPASSSSAVTQGYFTVTYNANGGLGEIAPQTDVEQGSSVQAKSGDGFSRTGYTFAGWKNAAGDPVAVGDAISDGTTLYAQWTPNQYTVVFNANGGSGTMGNQLFTYDAPVTALSRNQFTNGGYEFAGWSTSSNGPSLYVDEQKVQNLAGSGVLQLYALWAENLLNIGGTISGAEGLVTIELKRGNETIRTLGPEDKMPSYQFPGVPEGTYNLVATDEYQGQIITVTYLVTVESGTINIEFPSSSVSSKLVVSEEKNTPPVVVGGLDQEAVTKAEDQKSVTVVMSVESVAEEQVNETASAAEKESQIGIANIKIVAEEDNVASVDYLSISLARVIDDGTSTSTEPIKETSTVLHIIIPFDTNGKNNFRIYSYHDGAVISYIETNTREAGTFYVESGEIHIFAQKFSEFGIGYSFVAPTPSYTPSSSRQTGYTVILPESTEPTVTPTQIPESAATPLPTAKPTTQPTQQSPAPFAGILAGLGAAAVLLRMKR